MVDEDSLRGLTELLQDALYSAFITCPPFGRHALRVVNLLPIHYIRKENDIILVSYLSGIVDIIFHMLNIAVGIWKASE